VRVDHIALWTHDLDRCKRFFCRDATEGAAYVNAKKGFESCFLTFADYLRRRPWAQRTGFTHLDMSVGSERLVDELIQRIREDGHQVLDGPRRTRGWLLREYGPGPGRQSNRDHRIRKRVFKIGSDVFEPRGHRSQHLWC
jgi:lactoylglutathione lyase